MIKVSDFIFQHLVKEYGISECFLVTGGGAMHLNDSIGHTPGLHYTCNHHEQASAIAAEGYWRTSGKMCVTCVTTGPGGTNAVTGVLGQWLDSIPGIYISGQIKTQTMKGTYPDLPLRQLGDQEADIVEIVRSITKYAVTVTDPKMIRHELDKAMHIAVSGRPGPVWIDVPLDVQAAVVDETKMETFSAKNHDSEYEECREEAIAALIEKMQAAKSPVIYAGGGIRYAGKAEAFVKLAEKLGIPVVKSISGADLLPYGHPLNYGGPGICGERLANIMVQNADLLIILGTRLGIRQIGYAFDLFAPKAYKVMVDADKAEMEKPTLRINMALNCELGDFLGKLDAATDGLELPDWSRWRAWGHELGKELPTLRDDNPTVEGFTNSYIFAEELSRFLTKGDVVVTGNGTAYTCTYQAIRLPEGSRIFANQGCAAMGYDLPAAIGAVTANEGGRTILVTGDGSLQMNIQELQTLMTYKLPLKIFVLENEGYLAIKTTQRSFFGGNYTGSDPSSGVICPDLSKIAAAYGISYRSTNDNGEELDKVISETLAENGPAICEIHMAPIQTLFPKSASFMDANGKMSSAPLEKMAPFMSDELQAKCIYKEK